jgi:hypothetical protein
MMRVWLTIGLIVLGIAAAKAIPVEQQIIIFGGQSSASGSGGGGGCVATGLKFNVACNSQFATVIHF